MRSTFTIPKKPTTTSNTTPKTTRENELPAGRIAGVFGLRGELKCDPSSAARSVFLPGASIRCELRDGSTRELTVERVREHKRRLLIRFEGVGDAATAAPLVGAALNADAASIELGDGEYLDRDLIGCRLEDETGRDFGRVTRVEHLPSSDMLCLGERMVPLVRSFIREIDVARKRVVISVPPGLLD